MRTMTLCLAAALICAPAALLAQDSTASASTGADARIDAALESAVNAGIPVSLLERKVAEGKAKGVPMDRIAAAVERRLDALTHARDVLLDAGLKSTTEGELSVAADAVQAGVSQSALAAISERPMCAASCGWPLIGGRLRAPPPSSATRHSGPTPNANAE